MSSRDGQPESIRHRLRNRLRERGEDVGSGLQRYAAERFLYRLGRSPHRNQFVLKGATLFAIWGTAYRPTRDLDFTAYVSPDPDVVIRVIREVVTVPDPVDELIFDTDSITAKPIRDPSEYQGLRVRLEGTLGDSRIPLQIDIGFGNAIVPGPEEVEFRTLLGDPAPQIRAYPHEAVVAEKLHAMVVLGEENSRYKDFYDLYVMTGAFPFDRDTLARAVAATFERRATSISAVLPVALTSRFFSDKRRDDAWRSYVSNYSLPQVPHAFTTAGHRLVAFLVPIWEDLASGSTRSGMWPPGGPWGQA